MIPRTPPGVPSAVGTSLLFFLSSKSFSLRNSPFCYKVTTICVVLLWVQVYTNEELDLLESDFFEIWILILFFFDWDRIMYDFCSIRCCPFDFADILSNYCVLCCLSHSFWDSLCLCCFLSYFSIYSMTQHVPFLSLLEPYLKSNEHIVFVCGPKMSTIYNPYAYNENSVFMLCYSNWVL